MDASGKGVNSARVLSQLEGTFVRVLCPLGVENKGEFISLSERDSLSVRAVDIPGRTRECWTLLSKKTDEGVVVCSEVSKTGGETCGWETTELVCPENASDNFFAEYEKPLLDAVSDELSKCDAVLFAGSTPPGWNLDVVSEISSLIKKEGKPFLADYQGEMLKKTLSVTVPDIIKINEEEYIKTFALPENIGEDELKVSIAKKSVELGCYVVVTRGGKSVLGAKDGELVEVASERVAAVNTTACGDSFSAGFLYQYMKDEEKESASFVRALEKGTWCAARNAESLIPGSVR